MAAINEPTRAHAAEKAESAERRWYNPPMRDSRIAVIVPVYNRPRVALDALEGVLAQRRRPDRVIVVDDGSSDHSAEAVERWLAREGVELDAELIRQPNQGVSAARNRGAEAAAFDAPADLLAFLDSDDIWPPDYLDRAERAFAGRPEAVVAAADRLNINERTGEQRLRPCQWVESADLTARLLLGGPPGMSNTVYRASTFHEIGGFDPALPCGEDYHLHLRASLRGPFIHLPGAPVNYREHTIDAAEPQQQLSRRYDDRRLRIAEMLQRFVDEEGGAAAVAHPARRRRLGRAWYAAGRQLRRAGCREQARDCFDRASQLLPWHLRARLGRFAHRTG